jgi:hypothetical protein
MSARTRTRGQFAVFRRLPRFVFWPLTPMRPSQELSRAAPDAALLRRGHGWSEAEKMATAGTAWPFRHCKASGRTWPCFQAALPLKKCATKEITAIINKRWISPPATWNAKSPSIHITNKIANSTRNIEISLTRFRASALTRNPAHFVVASAAALAATEAKGPTARV